ncbi:hypothetical protein CTAYLR_008800 [Chrysophaeum taylorii]|uniref:Uncharacterized protein n=1 Tax=Chrysophaeum taylorii TaxID=2483200 RepID=A0AAD7UIG5_9STRA|nr:hypothetical protein CTAYLR_008800 [Chrysophaeum taylorii]
MKRRAEALRSASPKRACHGHERGNCAACAVECDDVDEFVCGVCGGRFEGSALVAAGQLAPFGVVQKLWRCYACEDSRGVDSIVASKVVEARSWYLVRWNESGEWHASWCSEERLSRLSPIKLRNFERRDASPDVGDEAVEVDEAWRGADRAHLEELWGYGLRATKVHRVIAIEHEANGRVWFMVKWDRSPYNECTWELGTDVEFAAAKEVRAFEAREARGVATIRDDWESATRGPDATVGTPLDAQPPWLVGGTLHGYQLEGINWLRSKWLARQNVILADEMGLGKTITSAGLLASVAIEHYGGAEDPRLPSAHFKPSLVVAPLSTLQNWERELGKWCPTLNVVVLQGNQAARAVIRHRELFSRATPPQVPKFHCLVTSFEVACSESATLHKLKWAALVVDEGHRLKSGDAGKLFQELVTLSCDHRVILTGTPLQNSLQELFHLIKFLDPTAHEALPPASDVDGNHLESLRAALEGRMLRRLKADVLHTALVPAKRELVVHVELTPSQRAVYKAVLTNNYATLATCDSLSSSSDDAPGASAADHNQHHHRKRPRLLDSRTGSSASASVPKLQNIVIQLRKVCNHTALMAPLLGEDVLVAAAAAAATERSPLDVLLEGSGKLALLDKMLARWKASGHRVLIFSQMTTMLTVLEEYLSLRNYSYERLDGSTATRDRQVRIDRFNAPGSDIFVFLLSTRAGGLGINLATADTVVIYDVDWNPHNDLQALARAHRIGQTQRVAVYRLVSRASVEERMIHVAKRKLCLEHAVVARGGSNKAAVSRKELDDVLRYGAERLFKDQDDDDDADGSQYITWDDRALDALLDRDDDDDDDDAAATNGGALSNDEARGEKTSFLSSLMDSFKVAKISFATKAAAAAAAVVEASPNNNENDNYEHDANNNNNNNENKDEPEDALDEERGAEPPRPPAEVEDEEEAAVPAKFQWRELIEASYKQQCEERFTRLGKGKRERRTRSSTTTTCQSSTSQVVEIPDAIEELPRRRRTSAALALCHLANRIVAHGLVGAVGGRWDTTHEILGACESIEETRARCLEVLERCLENDDGAVGQDAARVLSRIGFFALVERCLVRSFESNDLVVRGDSSIWEPRAAGGKWTRHHDRRLLAAVCCHGYGRWERILAGDRFGIASEIYAELDARQRRRRRQNDEDEVVDVDSQADEKQRKIEASSFLRERVKALEKALVAIERPPSIGATRVLQASLDDWTAQISCLLPPDRATVVGAQTEKSRLETQTGAQADSDAAALAAHCARLFHAHDHVSKAERNAESGIRFLQIVAADVSVDATESNWHLGAEVTDSIGKQLAHCRDVVDNATNNVNIIAEKNRLLVDLTTTDLFGGGDSSPRPLLDDAELQDSHDRWSRHEWRQNDAVIRRRTNVVNAAIERWRPYARQQRILDPSPTVPPPPPAPAPAATPDAQGMAPQPWPAPAYHPPPPTDSHQNEFLPSASMAPPYY